MTTALLTHYTDPYQVVADLTIPNRDEYCARHGYTHVVHYGPYRDLGLYYAIERLHRLYDLLFTEPNPPDLVWVLNVQSVITNLTIPVEGLCDADHSFWIARDCNGVNAGSFLIRRSEWSREWLTMLMELSPRVNHCWHENEAMRRTYDQSPWREQIRVYDDQRAFNSYLYSEAYSMTHAGQWQVGDLALSLPGTDLHQRLGFIKTTLPKVVR